MESEREREDSRKFSVHYRLLSTRRATGRDRVSWIDSFRALVRQLSGHSERSLGALRPSDRPSARALSPRDGFSDDYLWWQE